MTALAARPAGLEAAATSVVRAAGLGRTIDGRPVLSELDFSVPAGCFVALLGANGAGKSTLLKVLATLMPASCGELALFGNPVRRSSIGIRARIGLVGHAPMLYRDLSARENLVFFGRLYGVPAPADRADALLEFTGLSSRAHDPVAAFSRGMAQRLGIARALMHEPELLLADEPFAGLDPPSRDLIEQALATLHGQGRTIVLASHDLEQSVRVAEQVMVLRAGRLAVDAPAAGLDPAALRAEVTAP